jgi:uncharacterized protein (DUF885 family)
MRVVLEPIRELAGTVPILRSPRSKMGLSPSPSRFADRLLIVGALLLLAARPLAAASETPFELACDQLAQPDAAVSDTERLHRLFDLYWAQVMKDEPAWATLRGYPGQNDRWADYSPEAIALRNREIHGPVRVLESIAPAKLSADDRLSRDLLLRSLRQEIEAQAFHEELLAINQMDGPHEQMDFAFECAPRQTVGDYNDQIARLDAAPVYLAQITALLKQGLQAGITPSKITLRDLPDQFTDLAVDELDKHPFCKAFSHFPATISAADQQALKDKAQTALRTRLVPAMLEFRDFLRDVYVPGCRQTIAWSDLPQGAVWYAYLVKRSTTTDLTPAQIHQLGLDEVARISAEMQRLRDQIGFQGTADEFNDFLSSDAQFFYAKRQDLLQHYREVVKRIEPQLPSLFNRLPANRIEVEPVPAFSEKSQPAAYYMPGNMKTKTPGRFVANLYNLKSRPKWSVEVLTVHEAIPGHHLQLSIAEELKNLPEFRKVASYTAYVEGWGLYAEGLGKTLGLYQDPYSEYGALVFEMWRAVRLVVDTGLHSMHWSREMAIDYFEKGTPKDRHEAEVEIDRYIVLAGQALAYKIGQLKFLELRDKARRELGDRFDIRTFHDTLLGSGALPLSEAELLIDRWIDEQKAK